jgi:hypothetical protein
MKNGWETVVRQDLSVWNVLWSNGRLVEVLQSKAGTVPATCEQCGKVHR